jgi:hypothetical protein
MHISIGYYHTYENVSSQIAAGVSKSKDNIPSRKSGFQVIYELVYESSGRLKSIIPAIKHNVSEKRKHLRNTSVQM